MIEDNKHNTQKIDKKESNCEKLRGSPEILRFFLS